MRKQPRPWNAVGRTVLPGVTALLVALFMLEANGRAQPGKGNWVVAWTTSMVGLAQNVTLTNATVRMTVRPTITGSAVRVRLDNTFGTTPLTIGAGYVGISLARRGLVEGSNVKLTFGGSPSVTIAAGQRALSDQIMFRVEAWQDVAVSLFLPDTKVPVTSHNGALTTSYLTPNDAGNHAAESSNTSFTETTAALYFVSSLDVLSNSAQGAIIAFGDSITDGTCSVLDAHNRWEDVLALRLLFQGGREWAVVNEGIGGNTVTRQHLMPPPDSPPGLERLDRDVLQLSGVTHVIVFEGTNDIRRDASSEQVIAGLRDIIKRLKAVRLKVIGVTIIPRHNVAASANNTGWSPAKTAIRNTVNDWIRHRADFDAVIDFDKVVWNPDEHDLIDPAFNCGDGIHPTPLGYLAMGRAIDLKIFR
jgi:lysophospholipase L1-like esterase